MRKHGSEDGHNSRAFVKRTKERRAASKAAKKSRQKNRGGR